MDKFKIIFPNISKTVLHCTTNFVQNIKRKILLTINFFVIIKEKAYLREA